MSKPTHNSVLEQRCIDAVGAKRGAARFDQMVTEPDDDLRRRYAEDVVDNDMMNVAFKGTFEMRYGKHDRDGQIKCMLKLFAVRAAQITALQPAIQSADERRVTEDERNALTSQSGQPAFA